MPGCAQGTARDSTGQEGTGQGQADNPAHPAAGDCAHAVLHCSSFHEGSFWQFCLGSAGMLSAQPKVQTSPGFLQVNASPRGAVAHTITQVCSGDLCISSKIYPIHI